MNAMTDREATLNRLQLTQADYTYERFVNGDVTLEVFPPVIGQDGNGDWLHTIGPVQVIRFREDGSMR